MKTPIPHTLRSASRLTLAMVALLVLPVLRTKADLAALLFEDEFTGGIPGWTAVQPLAGIWVEEPMVWQFDAEHKAFSETSNIYTGASVAGSDTRIAVMLISDFVAPTNFGYTARLMASDDDGFGLIWGYENEETFYRLAFSRQATRTTGWPALGVTVDRMSNNVPSDIYYDGGAFVNTQYQPFDVSVGVTNGLLTVVVNDDPLGTVGGPFTYIVVTDLALPSTVEARVGIFSWGMNGGIPRSFYIQNPVVNGVAIDADAVSQVLSNWSFTMTPSLTGDYLDDPGNWSQGLDINGDKGVMMENLDWAPENTDHPDTPVHAAYAGDINWTNYVYSARFNCDDNDGFGMFVRWQDRTNWYRIGLRNQAGGVGINYGVTVQKNVNRNFDQVFASTAFIPPQDADMDIHAAISGQTLQLMCVLDPDSTSPTITSLGPIDMTASAVTDNLTNGMIGAFSWAQYGNGDGTRVDWVKVRKVDDQGLLVSSAFGTPDPPIGLNDIPTSGLVTAKVDSVVMTAPGVRQLADGWVGAGSVPSSGATNEVVFTMTQFSLISWKWQTQYLLDVSATAGGTAVPDMGPWVNSGSNVTITASADAHYVFTGWSGDNLSTAPMLTVEMVRPITLTANFAVDSDDDGLADIWENLYFGDLDETAAGDPDSDGKNNGLEQELGTNPTFAEGLVYPDPLMSRWVNDARDRAIPGWFVVTNFGGGFRGLWETSNQNRAADSVGPYDDPFINAADYATNASFQGPFIVVRTNDWDPGWANTFSLSAEYSVGDNDGICMYFRYTDQSNWFRVTVCGDDTETATRPSQSVSIQKRTNGWFSAVTPTSDNLVFTYNDELDTGSYKRLRITVNATNDSFEVRVIGWDAAFLNPPDWAPSSERIVTFTDSSLPTGRIGVGDWGMDGGKNGWNSTTNNPNLPGVLVNPVGAGAFVDNIVLQVDGTNAFVEDWETAPLHTDLPAGWENPYEGVSGYQGDWHVSGHGTIANFTAPFGTPQTGTTENPKADGEGPILLAPALTNANYVLELGIMPMDDGGMGFVYDFEDTNNFARVMFNSQVPAAGDLLQGLNVSRKTGGVWSDVVVGDNAFVYFPGRKFDVRFANNNGVCTLSAWNTDDPATVYHWQWADQPTADASRLGVAIWDMPDAHYTYVRAYSLPDVTPVTPFKISNISMVGGNIVLDVSKPAGANYHVLRAASVLGPYITNAPNQSAAQYSEPVSVGATYFYKLQLLP